MQPDALALVADGVVGIALCLLVTWIRSKFQL
jgi:hypothetical protein